MLLSAGARLDAGEDAPLSHASSRAMVLRLLKAGAEPTDLSPEGRRALVGLPPEADVALLACSPEDFSRACFPRSGDANPTRIDEPFWLGMIRAGVSAYEGAQTFGGLPFNERAPVWCAQRFGQSLTLLPEGRVVQIAGEHEDHYDPDFCIYNDVFVHAPDGTITIYGYPDAIFPPTDFHTATLLGEDNYLIGSLGYQGARHFGRTQVLRLSTRTFAIEPLETSGDGPGWISRHRAALISPQEIHISAGMVSKQHGGKEEYAPNTAACVLDVARMSWRRAPQ